MVDFSSNIINYTNLENLRRHLAEHLDCIHQYPETEPVELEKLLAEKLEIPLDCVMVTNGCTEAIYLLAQLFYGYSSIIPQPTFQHMLLHVAFITILSATRKPTNCHIYQVNVFIGYVTQTVLLVTFL